MGLVFGRRYKKLTKGGPWINMPSHNFGIVEWAGELWVGESVSPVAKLTSFANYERLIEDGEVRNVQLFEVCKMSKKRQAAAAKVVGRQCARQGLRLRRVFPSDTQGDFR